VSYLTLHELDGKRRAASRATCLVDITEPFSAIFARLSSEKPEVTRVHMALLNERYDLSNRPATGFTMDRKKSVQEGVRAFAFLKLPVYKHAKGFSQDEHRQHATEIQEREPAEPRPQRRAP
jgi:hypothetical protein